MSGKTGKEEKNELMNGVTPEEVERGEFDVGEAYGEAVHGEDGEKKEEEKSGEAESGPTDEEIERHAREDENSSEWEYIRDQEKRHPGTRIYKGTEIMVLNLADKADLEKYGTLMTKNSRQDNGLTIIHSQTQFSEKEDNWKVLLMVDYHVFKPILKKN